MACRVTRSEHRSLKATEPASPIRLLWVGPSWHPLDFPPTAQAGISKRSADVAGLQTRQSPARIQIREGSGHDIQSERPLELVELIGDSSRGIG